jgi:putative PIN family toxin of toxin-antitoxin system
VLDTNVLVAALRSDRGASRKILTSVFERRIQAVVSVPLMIEYEAVLTRSEHLSAAGLTAKEVNVLLDAFASVAEPVTLRFLWRPRLKDPADEMVMATAANGGVSRLVTFNLRHFRTVSEQFGIVAIAPPAAWKEICRDETK